MEFFVFSSFIKILRISLAFVFLTVWVEQAAAQELEFDQRKKLTDRDLAEKKEGGYFTGIAGPASSPDLGFVVAGIVYYYWNDTREDSRFAFTPYVHQISLNATYSTKGMYSFGLLWDAPYFLHTPYRIRFFTGFFQNPVAQYFGHTSQTMEKLQAPDGQSFSSYQEYNRYLRRIFSDGSTWSHYDYFSKTQLNQEIHLMRDFQKGIWRIFLGWGIHRTWIQDYSNQEVDVDGSQALMQTTRLRQAWEDGELVGYQGGYENKLKAGLVYDSRDFEPNPRSGYYHELIALTSRSWLGSDYDNSSILISSRMYRSVLRRYSDLVVAGRVFYSVKQGELPFYSLSELKFSDKEINGMGGMYSLRGYREPRFLGPASTGAALELRWISPTVHWGSQSFAFMLAPFVDSGRVFDDPQESSFREWRFSYGSGLRIIWNVATVISMDFGMSFEDFGFYLNVNQVY